MRLPDLTFRLEDTVPLWDGMEPMLQVMFTRSCSREDAVVPVLAVMEAEVARWCDANSMMKGSGGAFVEDTPRHDIRRVTLVIGLLGRN